MAKTLITGVAGLTGAHLLRKCLAGGDSVVGVDNYFRGCEANIRELFSHPGFTFHQMDFRDYIRRPDAGPFEEIYHLAAIVPTRYFYEEPELTYSVNCHGTYDLFLWALANGVKRFVNASSSEVYGHPQALPLKEDAPSFYDSVETTTRWSYAHGKIMTEYLLNAHKDEIELCHLRYANVYGPYDVDENHVVPYILLRLLRGRTVQLNRAADGIRRSFLYMSDCAEATWLAMRKMRSGESYNVGNPEEVTIQELYDMAAELLAVKYGIRPAGPPEYSITRAGDPSRRVLDCSRAAERLGFRPVVALREGLEKTAEWARECGP